MKKFLIAGLLAVGLVGCADVCAKSEECAKKAGTAFSITECRNEQTADREKVNTKGCSAEYSDASACLAALTCDQLNDANGILANCGAKLEKLNKCLQ